MKKKILACIVAVVMLAILSAACDFVRDEIQRAAGPIPYGFAEGETQHPDRPARGVWEEGIFTSEYLGLRFELPSGWFEATDEEMAALIGSVEGKDEADGISVIDDMWAANAITGAEVWIDFERLYFPLNRMSELNFIEWRIAAWEGSGWEFTLIFPDTHRIGNYDWYSFEMVWDAWDPPLFRHIFVNIQDSFVRTISIDFDEQSESVEDILSYFSNLQE